MLKCLPREDANPGTRLMMSSATTTNREIDRDALAWLIDPLTREEFERNFYEQRLCRVTRTNPSYYAGLLGVEDLDTVLSTHNITPPEVTLVNGAEDVPPGSYTDSAGRIDPLEVASRFDEGATVVFGQLHRCVPALARLCASIGKIFCSRVQTNIYFTPPHAQGFKPHWDTHDVFVLQVAGTKDWSIYDTKVTLPLKGQGFDPDQHEPGPVSEQFALGPGDVAYLPRGLMHSATASDQASLHITLGLTAFTWTDFFLESVAAAALEEESLRQTLPLGFADGSCPPDDRDRLYREKLEALQARFDPAPVWRHFQQELLAANTPLLTDLLTSRLREDLLTHDSLVGRRADLAVELENGADACVLRFSQRELSLPARVFAAVEFVTTRDVFAVRDLPDCVDAEGKMTLVRRLLKEGLLQRRASH